MPTGKNAFDFLLGDWRVRKRRLVTPFADSEEWVEFPARLEGSRKLLDGLVVMEQYVAEFDGKYFEGLSTRVYDPARDQWTIYWMDTNRLKMIEQVVGAFDDMTGEFTGYGKELFEGRPMKMRFVWKDMTADSARWEQAYLNEARGTWDTNWIMEFTRTEE